MDAKRKAKTRSHSSSPEEKKSPAKRLREAEAERVDDDQDNAAHRSQFPSVDHLQVVQCNIRESYPVYHPESLDHHDCSPGTCRPNIESEASMKNYARTVHSPLILPLLFGWDRNGTKKFLSFLSLNLWTMLSSLLYTSARRIEARSKLHNAVRKDTFFHRSSGRFPAARWLNFARPVFYFRRCGEYCEENLHPSSHGKTEILYRSSTVIILQY